MKILAISPGRGFHPQWKPVLDSGVDGVMIREKDLDAGELLGLARRAAALAPGLPLWINGRLDVALLGGWGLHAPESHPDLPAGLVPLSRPLHRLEDLEGRLGADQLILSPVFPTPGKGAPLGPEGLFAWLDRMEGFSGTVLALGGITPENVGTLRHPRLDGIALIRGLWESPDPAAEVRRLREAWKD